jgi:hypothetical protein
MAHIGNVLPHSAERRDPRQSGPDISADRQPVLTTSAGFRADPLDLVANLATMTRD